MSTTVVTNDTILQVQVSEEISINVVQPSILINTIESEEVHLTFTDIGIQGLPGAQGPEGPIGQPLEFNLLTEEQKIELRGDVGNTSTNYTNLFNSVLLS